VPFPSFGAICEVSRQWPKHSVSAPDCWRNFCSLAASNLKACVTALRYIAAPFVAFVAWIATIWLGAVGMFGLVPDKAWEWLAPTLSAISGFTGVLSGTLCLEQKSRRFGAIILLAIGLGFSIGYWWYYASFPGEEYPYEFHWLPRMFWPMAVGGTGAVLLNWFKFKKIGVPAASGKN